MSASPGLTRVLDRRLAALHTHLPAALRGDVTGVHQARVASRRLRETLPILEAIDPGDVVARAQRAIRRVTRALGPVREADVTLGLLADHLAAHPEESTEGVVVRTWLENLRAARGEAMLDALGERRVARLWTRVDALRRLVADHADQPDLVWRRVLADRIRTRAEALLEEIARAGVMYAPEPLHAIRIATKKLRYAVELAGDLHLGATVSALRTLKRQQELLGRIHDLEILAGLADRAAAEAPRYVSSARLVGDWHREVRERHASYLRARPRLEQVVTALATKLPVSVAGGRRRLGGKHGRTRHPLPGQARHRRQPRR